MTPTRRTILTTALFLLYCAAPSRPVTSVAQEPIRVETAYDEAKDTTTIKLLPVRISEGQDKYVSLHMIPSFSFRGRSVTPPTYVDFELQTVVRGRLKTDLYVVFMIDGAKVFLSSNRWAVKRPVPGRVWLGEHLVFRMPYEMFVRITKAKDVEIKFDAVVFSLGQSQQQALRDFLVYMQPATAPAG